MLDGGVQLNLANFGELHDGEGGERFGRGAEDEGRLRRGRCAAGPRPAKAALVHDAVALDDSESHAGNTQAAHCCSM